VPNRHERWVLDWNDRRLAVLDHDVDAIIRTHARDRRIAAWFKDTAEALLSSVIRLVPDLRGRRMANLRVSAQFRGSSRCPEGLGQPSDSGLATAAQPISFFAARKEI
jgi:hypothetical protein